MNSTLKPRYSIPFSIILAPCGSVKETNLSCREETHFLVIETQDLLQTQVIYIVPLKRGLNFVYFLVPKKTLQPIIDLKCVAYKVLCVLGCCLGRAVGGIWLPSKLRHISFLKMQALFLVLQHISPKIADFIGDNKQQHACMHASKDYTVCYTDEATKAVVIK